MDTFNVRRDARRGPAQVGQDWCSEPPTTLAYGEGFDPAGPSGHAHDDHVEQRGRGNMEQGQGSRDGHHGGGDSDGDVVMLDGDDDEVAARREQDAVAARRAYDDARGYEASFIAQGRARRDDERETPCVEPRGAEPEEAAHPPQTAADQQAARVAAELESARERAAAATRDLEEKAQLMELVATKEARWGDCATFKGTNAPTGEGTLDDMGMPAKAAVPPPERAAPRVGDTYILAQKTVWLPRPSGVAAPGGEAAFIATSAEPGPKPLRLSFLSPMGAKVDARLAQTLAGGVNGERINVKTLPPRDDPFWDVAWRVRGEVPEELIPTWVKGELSDTADKNVWVPYPKPQPIAAQPVPWVAKSEAAARMRTGCTTGYIVHATGTPIVSHYPERLERAQGFHFVEGGKNTDMLATAGIFPTRTPPFTTRRPLPPHQDLIAKLPRYLREWADGRHWHELFIPGTLGLVLEQLEKFQCDNEKDLEGQLKAKANEDNGAGAGGHRMRQTAGKVGGEVRVDYYAYHENARLIIEHGFIFELDEHGIVKIAGERELTDDEFSFKRNGLREYLEVLGLRHDSHGWPDESLDDLLKRGADDDTDGLPPVIVMSANHQGVRKAPGEFQRQVKAEQEAGFMGPCRDHPPFIPFTVVAGNLVPKDSADGKLKFRKVHDLTWPAEGTMSSSLGGVPLAPNRHAYKGMDTVMVWTHPQMLAQRAEVLAALAQGTPYKVLMRTWDLANWFRQIPQAFMDRRKNTVMVGGRYVRDDRLVMGKATASHQGDRLSFLIVDFLEHRFDAEFPKWLKSQDVALQELHRTWDEGRVQVFGEMPEQRRWASWLSFQDDIIAICFSEQLAEFVTELTSQVIGKELGVTLSVKPAASRPFSDPAEAIGCRLYLNGTDRHMEPREETQRNFRTMVQTMNDLGPGRQPVKTDWLKSLIGLFGHICRFLPKGNALRNSGSMLLRPSRFADPEWRYLKPDMQFCKDVNTAVDMLDRKEFLPLVAEARAIHGGMLSCAADACMPTPPEVGGWGFVIGQSKYSCGAWPRDVVEAWEKGMISISPLEYLVALFAHYKWAQGLLAGEHRERILGGVTISRSDNLAACLVSRRLLSATPTMAYFARRQAQMEAELGVRIVFDHIAGRDNVVPDLLSRGDELGAKAEMVRCAGTACVPTKLTDLGAEWDSEVRLFMDMVSTLKHVDGEWCPEDARMAEGEYQGAEDDGVVLDPDVLRGPARWTGETGATEEPGLELPGRPRAARRARDAGGP